MCCHCTDVLKFLEEGFKWQKKTHSDVASLPESAALKNAQLNLMLSEITNYAWLSGRMV